MTIWFYLWLVLSAALLYFMGWTFFILYKQKKAWKVYARKKKLRYTSQKIISSPEINGVVDGYTVSLFTAEHATSDNRSTRKLTAIEINLSSHMPFQAAVASGGMVAPVQGLGMKEEIIPSSSHWDKSCIASTNNRAALESYLSPDRLESVVALMKMKNAWFILIFRNDVALLRIDTPDPLDTPEKIDRLVKRMIEAAKLLELKPGEENRLKATVVRKPAREAALRVSEKDMKNNAGLSLEEEPSQVSPAAPETPPES